MLPGALSYPGGKPNILSIALPGPAQAKAPASLGDQLHLLNLSGGGEKARTSSALAC